MSGCNPEQSPNNKSTRDVTARRLNPYAKWVCGHSELGFACSHGPTSKGQCSNHQKTCEQQNSEREPNAESACNSCELACHQRANASGASSPWKECEAVANSPCVPVRSGWSFRNTLAINLAVGTSGLLLCMMLFPQREATFVPGNLSSKHAQILDNKLVSERCSLCHPNSHTKSELTSALATQDELCIRCHENQLPQLHLASPHDLPRAELRQISLETLFPSGLRNSNKSFDGKLVSTNLSSEESSASDLTLASISKEFSAKLSSSEMETRCANCHVEHHGREQNLQAITDQRCQSCHAKQFDSFNNGHPDFKDFPRAQPRSIAFTHQAHMEKHFAKKNETFECSKCHVDTQQRGAVGSVFRTLGFDTACARCHEETINAATVDGWVMLQLPSVQPADTKSSDLAISDWPASAQFGYEGTIPLAMRSLLMSDASTAAAINSLPDSGDLKAIPNFALNGRTSTLQIAAGTRKLIRDIASEGQAAWRKRLETLLTSKLGRNLQSREQRLLEELCAGLPPDIFRQMEQQWFAHNGKGIVSNSETPSEHGVPISLISLQQDDDLLLGNTDQPKPNQPKQGQSNQTGVAASDDDLLLSNSATEQLNANTAKPGGSRLQKLTKLRGAVHVVEGGWYLDHETLSLRYMPRGHNDRTLAAWSEFATLVATNSGRASLASQVPGGCTQCHTLSAHGSSGSLQHDHSTWLAQSKQATTREITKFDHTPHLTLPALMDCKYCHKLSSSSGDKLASQEVSATKQDHFVSTQLASKDAGTTVVCEFKSMHIEQCTACHRPNAASTGCTQCHNYHVTAPSHELKPQTDAELNK